MKLAKIPKLKSPHDDSALNIQNLVIDTVNTLGRSIQDLVVKGQLTPSQFSQLMKEINGLLSKGQISVHDIDKNKGLIDQSFLTPELLKQIAGTAPILSTIADGSVTTSKLANKAVDLSKMSDELNQYLHQAASNNIFVTFELGGWATSGSKVTSAEPKNLRSTEPIFLKKGMKVKQTPKSAYRYELIERNSTRLGNEFYVKRSGMKTFGEELEIENSNFYYIIVERTNGATMTNDDVGTVNRLFVEIVMNYQSLMGFETTSLELGGWSTDGNKVTSESPINIRSAEPIELKKGESFGLLHSDEYMYEFIVRSSVTPSSSGYIERTGRINFGNSYKATQDAYYYLVIHNKSGRTMTVKDLDNVDKLVNSGNTVDRQFIINILEEYGITEKTSFDLGGWWTSGNRTSSDSPVNVSPLQLQPIKSGEVLSFSNSSKYEYELFIFEGNEFKSRTGYRPLSSPYTSQSNSMIAINVRKPDSSVMTNSDASEVSQLFNGIGHSKEEDNKEVISKFSLVGDLNSYESHDLDYLSNPNNIKPQEVNDLFIALANAHKDLVSYRQIGKDNFSNNLYAFEIKPHTMLKSPSWNTIPTESTGEPLNIPKIIITSGIHGREKNANYAVYYFMKHLLENKDNSTLNTLLSNVHFVIIPMICPSGFEAVTYNNKADVNLNRDFPPHGNATQPETKAVKAVLDQHEDADYHIDFHNHTAHDTVIGYSLTDDKSMARVTTNAYKLIGRQWQIKHSELPQNRAYQWGYTSGANIGTVGRYTQSVLGIPSSIIETAVKNPWVNEGDNGRTITQMGVDLLANVLIGLLKARG